MNLQKVAGGKKFLELVLEAVNFTGYRLIRRILGKDCIVQKTYLTFVGVIITLQLISVQIIKTSVNVTAILVRSDQLYNQTPIKVQCTRFTYFAYSYPYLKQRELEKVKRRRIVSITFI